MLRVTKNTGKITSIKRGDFSIDSFVCSFSKPTSSFVIIPGVTEYKNIYSQSNQLIFDHGDYKQSIYVEFTSEGELDRFFTMLMREIKINQITNVSVDTKNK